LLLGDRLSRLGEGLEKSADAVLGHLQSFLVGLPLGDASRECRDGHDVSTFLRGFQVDRVSEVLHVENDTCILEPTKDGTLARLRPTFLEALR
jgi:hypothetical protein